MLLCVTLVAAKRLNELSWCLVYIYHNGQLHILWLDGVRRDLWKAERETSFLGLVLVLVNFRCSIRHCRSSRWRLHDDTLVCSWVTRIDDLHYYGLLNAIPPCRTTSQSHSQPSTVEPLLSLLITSGIVRLWRRCLCWLFSNFSATFNTLICRESFFMKLFKTTDMQVVEICCEQFDFVLPSLQLDRRRRNFVSSPVTTYLVKFFSCLMFYILYIATMIWWIKVYRIQAVLIIGKDRNGHWREHSFAVVGAIPFAKNYYARCHTVGVQGGKQCCNPFFVCLSVCPELLCLLRKIGAF